MIRNIDQVVEWAAGQVRETFQGVDYHLDFKIYGKNGVMGSWSLSRNPLPRAVRRGGGVAPTKNWREEITLMGAAAVTVAGGEGTAGTAAFVVDEVLPACSVPVDHEPVVSGG